MLKFDFFVILPAPGQTDRLLAVSLMLGNEFFDNVANVTKREQNHTNSNKNKVNRIHFLSPFVFYI